MAPPVIFNPSPDENEWLEVGKFVVTIVAPVLSAGLAAGLTGWFSWLVYKKQEKNHKEQEEYQCLSTERQRLRNYLEFAESFHESMVTSAFRLANRARSNDSFEEIKREILECDIRRQSKGNAFYIRLGINRHFPLSQTWANYTESLNALFELETLSNRTALADTIEKVETAHSKFLHSLVFPDNQFTPEAELDQAQIPKTDGSSE